MTEQKLNRLLLVLSTLIFVLAIVAVLSPGVIRFWRWKLPVIFASLSVVLFFTRRLSYVLKVNLCLFGIFLVMASYTLELILPLPPGRGVDVAARKLRAMGQPTELFSAFSTHKITGPIIPLGAISNTSTILCQESRDWQVYKTDEFGFNNPQGTHRKPVDIALIGDSFTQGYCVPADKDIATTLRKTYPRTINLGIGGAGPLLRLATLREYAAPLKPKIVIWLETQNTIVRIAKEDRLKNYLNPRFTQSLRSRQIEIDKELHKFVESEEARYYKSPLRQRLLLVTLRLYIMAAFSKQKVEPDPGSIYHEQYREVLEVAAKNVKSWGGKFVLGFVNVYEDKVYDNKDFVRSVANDLNVPFLDLEDAFDKPLDFAKIYPNGNRFLHYGEGGYRLLGEYLATWLKENAPKTLVRVHGRNLKVN